MEVIAANGESASGRRGKRRMYSVSPALSDDVL